MRRMRLGLEFVVVGLPPLCQQRFKQHRDSKWRQREGTKRSQRTNPRISYEEIVDDMDELDQPKLFKYRVNVY